MKKKKFKNEEEIRKSPIVQSRYKGIGEYDIYRDFAIFNLNDMYVYYDMDIVDFYKKIEKLLLKYEKEGKYLAIQEIDMKHVVLSKHEVNKLTYWQFNAWYWYCIDKLHKDEEYSYKRLNMKPIMDEYHKCVRERTKKSKKVTVKVQLIDSPIKTNFSLFTNGPYYKSEE